MITAILVDDEQMNISNMKALLGKHCKNINVVATAGNATEAIEQIISLKPDVVFLDIEMPEQNGFDMLRSLPDPDFEIVFVTAYDHYGIMAVKFSALDYLLKPINITELKAAVDRVEMSVNVKKQNTRLNNLLSILDQKVPDQLQKIALPVQKETYLVAVKDIVRCESSNNYTTFFLTDATHHLISKPLYEYEELLAPYGFLRCHQSHLVNRSHITRILNEDSGYVILNFESKKIPISKQKKAIIRSQLGM